jgi:hypothetical protein
MSTQALNAINAAAAGAETNLAASVRDLTDTVFDRFQPHIPLGHSIRERVARNELAFRLGSHSPILETAVAAAVNRATDAHALSAWMRTSVAQLHLFRTGLRRHVPELIGAASKNTPLSEEMSPAEAAFVILYLYQGKLRNPEYQVAPENWVKHVENQSADRSRERLIGGNRSELPISSLEGEISRERSLLSRAIHTFFDDAGFQR